MATAVVTRKKRSTGKDMTAYENYLNYRFCYDNGHDQWVTLAAECFEFWRGRQWKSNVLAKLITERRPALTFNVIESLIRTMKGIQRSLRNDVRFLPTHDADISDAEIRDVLWMHVQNMNHLDFLETDTYERGLIMNRAFYQVSLDFDDNMQGELIVSNPRSQDVILDPTARSYDPNDRATPWAQVYHAPWMNLREIEHEWGASVARELRGLPMPDWYGTEDKMMAQRVGELPYYYFSGFGDEKLIRAFRPLIRQYRDLQRKDVFIDIKTGDTADIPRTWDRNRISQVLEEYPDLSTTSRKVMIVKQMVTIENTVIMDEESPFPKKFNIIPYFPTFLDGVSMGAVESLIGPQELFNKVTSQELHIINTTANSGYKLKKGVLVGMTKEELEAKGAKPGFVVELTEMDGLEKITPNSTPQGHDRISFKANTIMRELAGVGKSTQGMAREDVSGEAILSNQAAADVNFASWLANLHRSKQMLAEFINDGVQEYYTETRVIQINRGSAYRPNMQSTTINQPTPEGHVLNDITKGKYTTTLIPSPTRASLNENEFKELVSLRKDLNIQIPDDVMIECSNVPNKLALIQRLQGDSNAAQQKQQEAEAKQAALEHDLTEAKIAKEHGAADLNQARAEKFREDAGRDPDAAYERVETMRISADKEEADKRIGLDYAKLREQSTDRQHRTAVELTKLEHGAKESEKDRRADLTKTHMQGMQRRETKSTNPTKGKKK